MLRNGNRRHGYHVRDVPYVTGISEGKEVELETPSPINSL
jgi:hypothetical protein